MNSTPVSIKLLSASLLAASSFAVSATVTANFSGDRAAVASPNAVAVAAVRVGDAAPDFTGTDSNGKSHRLSDFKGKTVVLEWTNHDCPSVRKHYETSNMQKLQRELKAKGVIWLSIASSAPGQQGYVDAAKANDLTKTRDASPTAFLLDADAKIARLYTARTTPHMFVIAPNGKLAYMGAIDSDSSYRREDIPKAKNYVRAAVEELALGKPVSTPATQPYGCSVKY